MELRQQTGGFALVSAKEARPGVVVFRLRDQTKDGVEVLGTLQAKEYAIPAEIATFSLRSVPVAAATTAALSRRVSHRGWRWWASHRGRLCLRSGYVSVISQGQEQRGRRHTFWRICMRSIFLRWRCGCH